MVQEVEISCESLFHEGLSMKMTQQRMLHGEVNIQVYRSGYCMVI